jgi:hypothetical protein
MYMEMRRNTAAATVTWNDSSSDCNFSTCTNNMDRRSALLFSCSEAECGGAIRKYSFSRRHYNVCIENRFGSIQCPTSVGLFFNGIETERKMREHQSTRILWEMLRYTIVLDAPVDKPKRHMRRLRIKNVGKYTLNDS